MAKQAAKPAPAPAKDKNAVVDDKGAAERQGKRDAKAAAAHKKALTGRQKAAVFLVTLGSEIASEIFKHLREDEIEQLTFEIARLESIEPQERDRIMTLARQTPAKLVMLPDMMEILRKSFTAVPGNETNGQEHDPLPASNDELQKWFAKVNDSLDHQDIDAARATLQDMQNYYHRTAIDDD